jgi:small subunit ribosomal protein S20
MPNIQSARKRLKQSLVRQERNRSVKRSIRTECRKVLTAVSTGDIPLAETEFKTAAKKLDRAAARKVLHRNAAARTKSRLSARIKAAKKKAAPAK